MGSLVQPGGSALGQQLEVGTGKASAFHHCQNVGCSCQAGGPAAHDPSSMGLKLEGRQAGGPFQHRADSARSQQAPYGAPHCLAVTFGDADVPHGEPLWWDGPVLERSSLSSQGCAGGAVRGREPLLGSAARHHAADLRPPGPGALSGFAHLFPPLSRRQERWQQEE